MFSARGESFGRVRGECFLHEGSVFRVMRKLLFRRGVIWALCTGTEIVGGGGRWSLHVTKDSCIVTNRMIHFIKMGTDVSYGPVSLMMSLIGRSVGG